MVGLWWFLGASLDRHPTIAQVLDRYDHLLVPLVLSSLLAFLISGCANTSFAASLAPTAELLAVADKASLTAALEAGGVTVETGESGFQPFFTLEGSILKVNGADVQVFEYDTPEEMENEASQVSSDGGSIGTSMVTWMEAPHFYKAGRIIVLYVGSDAVMLDLLEGALGPPLAGR